MTPIPEFDLGNGISGPEASILDWRFCSGRAREWELRWCYSVILESLTP
jgi:hypothetical protein